MGCVVAIPQWFASAHTPGQRLGVGCGGYFSIIGTGNVSMGPALAAFAPPGTSAGGLTHTNLVRYPFDASDCSARANRNPDYTDDFDGCNPEGGVGRWTWADQIFQGAAWVDTPTKSGLVYIPNIGDGRVWYETSTLHAERASIWWYIYDPVDLARVAAGEITPSEIQPTSMWNANFPGLGTSLPGWSDGHGSMVTGVTYDGVAQRIYVQVAFAGDGGLYGVPKVYVYEIQ